MKKKLIKTKIYCTRAYRGRTEYVSYTVADWIVCYYLFGILINTVSVKGVDTASIMQVVPDYDVLDTNGLIPVELVQD